MVEAVPRGVVLQYLAICRKYSLDLYAEAGPNLKRAVVERGDG